MVSLTSKSKLSRYWAIASNDQASLTPDEMRERQEIESLKLPPLELVRKKAWPRMRFVVPSALLAAAMAALILFHPLRQQDHANRMKGGNNVEYFYQYNGSVIAWDKTTGLPAGTKIRARLTVSANANVSTFIALAEGNEFKILRDSESFTIEGGQKFEIPGSFELDGINSQHETIGIIICPQATSRKDLDTHSLDQIHWEDLAIGTSRFDIDICEVIVSRLR